MSGNKRAEVPWVNSGTILDHDIGGKGHAAIYRGASESIGGGQTLRVVSDEPQDTDGKGTPLGISLEIGDMSWEEEKDSKRVMSCGDARDHGLRPYEAYVLSEQLKGPVQK